MTHYFLDTSALIALRDDEKGADEVMAILRKVEKGTARASVCFMSFMELFYCVWRVEGKAGALRAYLELKFLPLQQVGLSESLLLLAGEIKASYSLSLADSWIAAAAIQSEATLVHKDPEYDQLKERLPLQPL